MATLEAYKKYNSIAYDYATQLPDGWLLLPNIAVFQERIERGHINEELLSVTIGRGVIKQTDVDIKKDSSNEDKSKYKLIKVGDIAYNKMRMWQGALGYSDYQGISSPAYVILKPKMKINPRYFHYMFRTSFYTNYSKRFSYGIVDDQLSLRYTDFKRMYSIVPPIEVQNSIVAYLDKKNNEIDKFIRNKERLIELLEEQRSSIINNILTSGVNPQVKYKQTNIHWLVKVPEHWEIKRLKIVIPACVNGVWGDESKNNENDIYCIRVADIDNKTYGINESSLTVRNITRSEQKGRLLKNNDLIIEKSGGGEVTPVGRVVLYNLNYKAVTSNFMAKLKVDKRMDKEFTYFILRQLYSNRLNVPSIKATTGIQNLDFNSYMQNLIAIPPIDEQKLIVDSIKSETSQIDLIISKAQKEISSIKEYREALITDLVTGKRSIPQLEMI
jgi:type I restriction enzyme S subunit